MDLKISEQFVADAPNCARLKNKSYLKELGGKFGFTDIAYMVVRQPTGHPQKDIVVTSYPKEWETRYVEKGYRVIDPVVSNSMRGVLPFDWQEVREATKQTKLFFGEAREFGVGSRGISIPIRGVMGEQALFSVSSTKSRREWSLVKQHLLPDLTYLGFLVHAEIVKSLYTGYEYFSIRLTPREREVLTWAAQGKTCWETGEILGLTERTVNFYIRNASTKLGAATKTQAVARAIQTGLISREAV